MAKNMLVNVTHVEESRVAVLDEGVLAAYEIETINRAHVKGNIHNAIVESVNPSLEAAFLKIGKDLKGFLPLDEVNFKLLPSRSDSRKSGKIGQHLHSGQKLLAQVVREPFAGKPATVSTYFSLPGRFLVLMPGVDSAGISRKIEDGEQRERLRKILAELNPPEGFGLIVRTAGMGQTKTELQRDLRYLLRLWESIQRASGTVEFPGLVYREADLVTRTIRDHLTSDIKEVWIDNQETYQKAFAFVKDVMPTRARILKLYEGDRPLFNKFNLEEQIERIYKRRVPLPSGGEIVIDGTEALTAIDVNSARSKRKGDGEEMVTQTNLEAAAEIARQLVLRDVGGLIVVDFIDMSATKNRRAVEKAMRDAMRGDRARHDVTRLSKLGLLEIARQRLKGAKMAASYATCPTCEGYGLVKNIETASLAALRKLQTRVSRGGGGGLRVTLPPEVADWLLNNKRDELNHLEKRHEKTIDIRPRGTMLRHESEFETIAGDGAKRIKPAVSEPAPAVRAPDATPDDKPAPAAQAAPVDKPAPAEPTPAESGGPAEPQKTADKPAEATENGPQAGTDEPPARRRRKRRRRPKSGGSGSGSDDASAGEPARNDGRREPSRESEILVPRGIRADELMPAAAPTPSRGKPSRKSKSTQNRRRGRGAPKSPRARRGGATSGRRSGGSGNAE